VKEGHEYLGLDYSPVAIKRGVDKGFGDFCLVDVQKDRSHFKGDYDVATFIEFLEHVPTDLEILADVPPGRTVIMSVPDYSSLNHFRFFSDLYQVIRRYRSLVSFYSYDILLVTNRGQPARMFILKGTRRCLQTETDQPEYLY